MSDADTANLLQQARAHHRDGVDHEQTAWKPWCYRCQAPYPCLPARLAAALEAAEREKASLALDLAAARTGGDVALDANTRLAARIGEMRRDLAAARDSLRTFGAHKSPCPARSFVMTGRRIIPLVIRPCECGFAAALASREEMGS